MNITTKRIKEIIKEEVKAMTEAGGPAEWEKELAMANNVKALDGSPQLAPSAQLDDEQIEADIQEMLNTLDLTDDQRNTLETIQHHILGGDMGIDDMPPLKTTRNSPFADRDEFGNRTLNKEGLARIIHEETVKAIKEGVVDMDGETIVTGPDGDASPEAQGLARQEDLQASMMKAALEIKNKKFEKAYETLLRALAAAGIEGGENLPGLEGGEELEESSDPDIQRLIQKAEFEVKKGRLLPGDLDVIKRAAQAGESAAKIKRKYPRNF